MQACGLQDQDEYNQAECDRCTGILDLFTNEHINLVQQGSKPNFRTSLFVIGLKVAVDTVGEILLNNFGIILNAVK
ncbi:hypothetical protein [Nostoc sp.]